MCDGTTVTNWYDSLQRPAATGDGIGIRWFGYLMRITNRRSLKRLTNATVHL
jgi:hypothetical protein